MVMSRFLTTAYAVYRDAGTLNAAGETTLVKTVVSTGHRGHYFERVESMIGSGGIEREVIRKRLICEPSVSVSANQYVMIGSVYYRVEVVRPYGRLILLELSET